MFEEYFCLYYRMLRWPIPMLLPAKLRDSQEMVPGYCEHKIFDKFTF